MAAQEDTFVFDSVHDHARSDGNVEAKRGNTDTEKVFECLHTTKESIALANIKCVEELEVSIHTSYQ